MQTSDISLYFVGIVVILASIYLFPLIFTGKVQAEGVPLVRKWSGKEKTVALESEDPALQHPVPVLEQVSRYGASWWNDESIFQFERRAIFSKTWIFVAHKSRFHKPGDYRTFEIAGFSFIVILGKDKQIRAFHNVCRHRAYAITKKESGSSTVLGCRYHGWSYDSKGKLIKAPEFDSVAGFNKDLNNLWELQTEIRDSMIFVNFDARDEKQAFDLDASEAALKRWKTTEMEWTTGWKIDGAFNWKLSVGELSLDRGTEAAPESLWQSIIATWQTSQDKEFKLSLTTIVRQLPSGQMLTIRILPQSAQATTIQCDVYAKKARINKAEQKDLHLLKDLIQEEVKKLEAQQQDLSAGKGAVSSPCQDALSELLKTHLRAERALGTEIHPAARKQSFNPDRKADDDLCAELENDGVCNANSKGLLDW